MCLNVVVFGVSKYLHPYIIVVNLRVYLFIITQYHNRYVEFTSLWFPRRVMI